MKKPIFLSLIIVGLIFSCTKQSDSRPRELILAGIKASKGSEIICMNIDSGKVVNSTPIGTYVLGSTVYDPLSGGFGYVDGDTIFRLVNPETGVLIKSIKLPGLISQVVIDNENNFLIGRYSTMTYGDDPDTVDTKSVNVGAPVYTNYVIRVDLASGAVVSNNEVYIGDGVYVSCYYYNQKEKGYVMYRSDQNLITVNPSTGAVIKEVYVGSILFNSVYNPENNTVITMTYSSNNDRNYIEVISPETGSLISSKLVEPVNGYCSNIMGYDAESNCYITATGDNVVLFYDISTGEIIKSHKLDNALSDVKFWRN
jgi:hypothetical protein